MRVATVLLVALLTLAVSMLAGYDETMTQLTFIGAMCIALYLKDD